MRKYNRIFPVSYHVTSFFVLVLLVGLLLGVVFVLRQQEMQAMAYVVSPCNVCVEDVYGLVCEIDYNPQPCESDIECFADSDCGGTQETPGCTTHMLLSCRPPEFDGCLSDTEGGTCVLPPGTPPLTCSEDTDAACALMDEPAECVSTVGGGFCLRTSDTLSACLGNCLVYGGIPSECNSDCEPLKTGTPFCSLDQIQSCARYQAPHVCLVDVGGGHCAPEGYQGKDILETCEDEDECRSGGCKRLYEASTTKYCSPGFRCTPGEIVERNPLKSSSCTFKCSDGGAWIKQNNDCTPPLPLTKRYCEGDILVVEEIETGVKKGQYCLTGCQYGVCTTAAAATCQPGDVSYIVGSCQGISGCPAISPDPQYDGDCMAVCSASNQWEVAPGCGKITIASNFSNKERFEILEAASRFDQEMFNFADVHFKRLDANVIEAPPLAAAVLSIVYGYDKEILGCSATRYMWGVMAEIFDKQIDVAGCGTYQGSYAHELTHYISSQFKQKDFIFDSTVGCVQHFVGSERYTFENEQPVSAIGNNSCEDAMAEASRMYQADPCRMKSEFPIQYNWMRDNLYGGKEFCEDGQSYLPQSLGGSELASYSTDFGQTKPKKTEVVAETLIEKLKKILIRELKVQASPGVSPYVGQFSIGSTRASVVSELGSATQTQVIDGLTVLTYDTQDPSHPKVFIFDGNDKLVYFRLNTADLKEEYKSVDLWITSFSSPEAVVSSNFDYLSTRLISSRDGFSYVVGDETGQVLAYEAFLPIYLDEYLDTWGEDVEMEDVRHPLVVIEGDVDRDGDVDIDDYNIMLSEFGNAVVSPADIDIDGKVDIFDYNLLVGNFGSS